MCLCVCGGAARRLDRRRTKTHQHILKGRITIVYMQCIYVEKMFANKGLSHMWCLRKVLWVSYCTILKNIIFMYIYGIRLTAHALLFICLTQLCCIFMLQNNCMKSSYEVGINIIFISIEFYLLRAYG